MSAPDPRTVAAETLAFFYATRHDAGSNPLGRAADSAARISADETFRGGPLALVYAQAYRLLSDRAMRLAQLHAQRIDRMLTRLTAGGIPLPTLPEESA